MPHVSDPHTPPTARAPRTHRRLLLGSTAGAAVAGAAALVSAPPARAAAPPATAWRLGGNPSVTAGNYLGTNNPAPLIIKTTPVAGGSPTEAMRITTTQRVGIGTVAPESPLHVRGAAETTVRCLNTATEGSPIGVLGQAAYVGVRGLGGTYGVRGSGQTGGYFDGSSTGASVYGGAFGVVCASEGVALRAQGTDYGVRGSGVTAVEGEGSDYGGRFTGVGHGVSGETTVTSGTGYGVFGDARAAGPDATAYAGGFEGDVLVSGTEFSGAAAFRIDHPLDPDNLWLAHASVESPDMMNVYNGNVTLNAQGAATVFLPRYFPSLNRDYRYQLTAIGAAAPNLHIAERITGRRFRIAGGPPNGEVSWLVTGIRQDPYATAHRIIVESVKDGPQG